jgi:hypothetical protein
MNKLTSLFLLQPQSLKDELSKTGREKYLGLEFIVEVTDEHTRTSVYFCGICSKIFDTKGIISNISSERHKTTYLVRTAKRFKRSLLTFSFTENILPNNHEYRRKISPLQSKHALPRASPRRPRFGG